MAPVLHRLAGAIHAESFAGVIGAAPADGVLLHWLGGSDGRELAVPAETARRLVLLAAHRSALRPLALRLRPAAIVEDYAFLRWQDGEAPAICGSSGIVGLDQAPLAPGSGLDVAGYAVFRNDGSPLATLLERYLTWFEGRACA